MINNPEKRFYEFDLFRIDIEERRLLHDDKPVRLTPKVFDILLVLVENSGRTLEKDDLMQRVWADAFVEEGSLNRNISTLRKVLGEDSREPRLIKTVPKRGYRFEGYVREVVEEGQALIVEKRTNYRVALRQETETVTRSNFEDLVLSRRFLLLAVPFLALVVLGLVWAVNIRSGDRGSVSTNAPAVRSSANPEANRLYAQGRALWQDRSADSLHRAIQHFEHAIRLDPGYALAHAGLADAYAFDIKLWQKAEPAAREAMRLDPALGEPHATIGFVRMFWEWRPREAEQHFQEAIKLSPDHATAHQWYGLNLAAISRGGDALGEMKRALELEPDSLAINADLCQVLYFSRKFDLAIDQCRKTIEMDPKFLNAHSYLYEVYTAKEMYPEAVAEYFKTEDLNMTTLAYPSQLEKLRDAFATGGIRAFWRSRIETLRSPIPNSAVKVARYHARLGESDEACRWLRHAYDNHEMDMAFFTADPAFESLLTDQRFLELGELLLDKPQP